MSGGGNPFSGSSKGGMQSFDPVGSLGTNLINGVLGTNLLGQGGMSNNWATQVGNNITGGNLFNAGNNQLNAADAANALANPTSIPQLPNVGNPQMHDPTSWGMPTPQGGFWNQIAQQMAGPMYTGGLQIPGVSPAMGNQPLGLPNNGQGALGSIGLANMSGAQSPGGKGGGVIPQNIAALQAGGLRNGFTTPGGLSPRGSIRAF